MKICSTCKASKPFEEFYINKRTLDGYCYQCKKCQIIYNKKWIEKNPEKKQIYIEKNISRFYAWNAKWRAENPEKIKERDAKYYKKNAEKIKEKKRIYRKENPEIISVARHRYRALKRNASGSYNKEDIQFLFISQRGLCAMCREDIKKQKHHVDHIMPLARQGTNDKTNLQLLCPTCNRKKSAKHPVDFAQQMGFLL
jgi:5-methylcytosine-specific restriction endonuclease McrA